MQTYEEEFDEEMIELNLLSNRVIGCAITVAKKLRPGYLEKVYENALMHELTKIGLQVENQVALDVHYDGIVVGEFFADIIINGSLILELKAVGGITNEHLAQGLNYLTTTNMRLCLILNFGSPRLGIKRVRN